METQYKKRSIECFITLEHLGENANTDSCSYGGHRMDAVSTITEMSPVQKTVDKEEVDKAQKEASLKKALSD
jgi:hypothetical protein